MRRLHGIIGVLIILVSLSSFFLPIYKEELLLKSQLQGQDIVTIFVGIFLICISFVKSEKSEIIKLGLIFYTAYTYLFLALSLKLNLYFQLYLIISVLSLIEMRRGVSSLLYENFIIVDKKTLRICNFYLIVMAIVIFALWNTNIMMNIIKDPILLNPINPTFTVIFVFDLCFIVPLIVFIMRLNRIGKSVGTSLMGALLIKMITMGLSLVFKSLTIVIYGLSFDIGLIVFWICMTVVGGLAFKFYWKNLLY